MRISLEDFYEDIIGKAQGGLRLSDSALLDKIGISRTELDEAKAGSFDEATARALAPALSLDTESLIEAGLRAWYPESIDLDGLEYFNTPYPVPGYQEMTVNAYLVWHPETKEAVVFDSGARASGILDSIAEKGLQVRLILLTHTHGDHIADLDRLRSETGDPPVHVNRLEPLRGADLFDEGTCFEVGSLRIEARLTHGHSPGGTTFVVNGLERPVAIVGDSLFANSMGGAMGAYQQALENNRAKILSLPNETVICAGHGPLTTVAEERAHNPFHPEFKST